MERISWGYSQAKIAASLSIGRETVRTHSANIRRKFGVYYNWELVGLPVPRRSNMGADE
jgi:DNA-binding NarL/FixJ family response regulator